MAHNVIVTLVRSPCPVGAIKATVCWRSGHRKRLAFATVCVNDRARHGWARSITASAKGGCLTLAPWTREVLVSAHGLANLFRIANPYLSAVIDPVGTVSDKRALWIARQILPHERALRNLLSRWRLPHDLDADDVVQEAYGRFAAMDSVDHILSGRGYLFVVARSIVVSHIRHSRVVSIRSVEGLEITDLPCDKPSPEDLSSDREQLHLLALAVSELAEPSRSAFLLRAIEEMSYREIGARLGMTDNAVQKNMAKSIIKLLKILGRGGNEEGGASSAQPQRREPAQNVRARDGQRD